MPRAWVYLGGQLSNGFGSEKAQWASYQGKQVYKRFVGIALNILGLVSSGLGINLGFKCTIPTRILKSLRGVFSSSEFGTGALSTFGLPP